MARRKPTTPALLSWDDVDAAMLHVINQDNSLTDLQIQLDQEIEALKAAFVAQAKPLQDDIKMLGSQIKQFVTEHQDDLGNKKTKQLLHGKTGFRRSTSCIIPKNTKATVIAQLEAMGLRGCVNIKKTVNREQLRQYPENVIEQSGAHLQVKNDFWYEVDHFSLAAED